MCMRRGAVVAGVALDFANLNHVDCRIRLSKVERVTVGRNSILWSLGVRPLLKLEALGVR